MLKFNIRHQSISRVDHFRPVEKSVKYLKARFFFLTDEWDEYEKRCLCRRDGQTYKKSIIDGECEIPWEVLLGGPFELCVVGKNGDTIVPTAAVEIDLGITLPGGPEGAEPTPSQYDELINRINALDADMVKSVNGISPDENGNVEITIPDSSQNANLTAEQIAALDGMFKIAAYTEDASAAYAAFKTAFGITGSGDSGGDTGGDDNTETEVTLSSISATYSGGDVPVGTAVTALTGIVVTATYSDGSTATVTDYTLSGTIAEGSNTITVSYGGKTTTFTVTGVAEEAPESTEPVYQLAEATTFNGASDYIDTGYQLVNEDKNWSICVAFTPTAKTGRLFDTSWNGTGAVYLAVRGGYYWDVYLNGVYVCIGHTVNSTIMCVVTHTVGNNNIEVSWIDSNGEKQTGIAALSGSNIYTNNNTISENTLILGAKYDKSVFYTGTIDSFAVYERVLTADEINEFLGVSA